MEENDVRRARRTIDMPQLDAVAIWRDEALTARGDSRNLAGESPPDCLRVCAS